MNKFDLKKRTLSEILADYVISEGINKISLRNLAKVVNMSDRMLLHYFKNKEELLTAVFLIIEERLEEILKHSNLYPMPYNELILHLSSMLEDEELQPYLKMALELLIKSVDEKYYGVIAKQIFNQFFLWVYSMVKDEPEKDRFHTASLVFTILEGFLILQFANSKEIIENTLRYIKQEKL